MCGSLSRADIRFARATPLRKPIPRPKTQLSIRYAKTPSRHFHGVHFQDELNHRFYLARLQNQIARATRFRARRFKRGPETGRDGTVPLADATHHHAKQTKATQEGHRLFRGCQDPRSRPRRPPSRASRQRPRKASVEAVVASEKTASSSLGRERLRSDQADPGARGRSRRRARPNRSTASRPSRPSRLHAPEDTTHLRKIPPPDHYPAHDPQKTPLH